jgi:hypothetical protein
MTDKKDNPSRGNERSHSANGNSHDKSVFLDHVSWSDPNEWMQDFPSDDAILNHLNEPSYSPYQQSSPIPSLQQQMAYSLPTDTGKLNRFNAVPSAQKSLKYEKKKISDAITYGPRFVAIFSTYCRHYNLTIDLQKHLFVLCLENLINFIRWARETNQVPWINEMLYQNDYLRPETRNGIVMVLIYTFAATKATVPQVKIPGKLDMFVTLKDDDHGLGIGNRFSLKIYNDPFYFLSFLKFSISSLIDAGVIPDNEKQIPSSSTLSSKSTANNVTASTLKTAKNTAVFNEEEMKAFQQLHDKLISLIETNQLPEAKNLVQIISTHWDLKGKVNAVLSFCFGYSFCLLTNYSFT